MITVPCATWPESSSIYYDFLVAIIGFGPSVHCGTCISLLCIRGLRFPFFRVTTMTVLLPSPLCGISSKPPPSQFILHITSCQTVGMLPCQEPRLEWMIVVGFELGIWDMMYSLELSKLSPSMPKTTPAITTIASMIGILPYRQLTRTTTILVGLEWFRIVQTNKSRSYRSLVFFSVRVLSSL